MKRLWHWLKDKWKIIKRSIVLLTALSQPITVIIAQRFGPLFEESGSDPFIIPADYAFLIWSIIVTGTIIYGIYQLLPFTYNYKYLDKISFQSILIFLGFDLWIMAALNVWLPTTVLIFMAMGVALRIVFRELLSVSLKFFEKVIVLLTFALYFGWTTVAVFANLASALHYYGLPLSNFLGLSRQLLVLSLAAFTAHYFLMEMKFSLPYFLTLTWAFIAIIIGTLQSGPAALPLTIFTIAATVVLLYKEIVNNTWIRSFS